MISHCLLYERYTLNRGITLVKTKRLDLIILMTNADVHSGKRRLAFFMWQYKVETHDMQNKRSNIPLNENTGRQLTNLRFLFPFTHVSYTPPSSLSLSVIYFLQLWFYPFLRVTQYEYVVCARVLQAQYYPGFRNVENKRKGCLYRKGFRKIYLVQNVCLL